jgi:hypothetical protein
VTAIGRSTSELGENSPGGLAGDAAENTGNVLGTSTERRQVRDATSNYTEMLVSW